MEAILEGPQPGDRYLLGSDGLAGPASDAQIRDITVEHKDLKVSAQALIDQANNNGGPDNITAVVLRWMGSD